MCCAYAYLEPAAPYRLSISNHRLNPQFPYFTVVTTLHKRRLRCKLCDPCWRRPTKSGRTITVVDGRWRFIAAKTQNRNWSRDSGVVRCTRTCPPHLILSVQNPTKKHYRVWNTPQTSYYTRVRQDRGVHGRETGARAVSERTAYRHRTGVDHLVHRSISALVTHHQLTDLGEAL